MVVMIQVSGVILPEPGVNVQAHIEAAINQVMTEPGESETGEEAQQRVERPVIPWQTVDSAPASEFTTPYIFTMSFLCLFPFGKGDFHINHKRTCPALHGNLLCII